ncbi:CopD family copper resistance protein [Pseudomonas sp. UM16]|uniref:CopD family copper resistance protein n=1 Tax=Pseudomonas sp. UM16 TaxID=3158962 RepID=UPI00398FF779
MLYPYLLVVHLLAAIAFIGTLFFEVVIWQTVRRQLPTSAQPPADQALSVRSRKVLHAVVLLLYGAGIGLAWHHRAALRHPLDSSFASLLSLKIVLALSIIGHYLLLAYWLQRGRLNEQRARWIRWSILGHMLVIVMLAKGMFYWH